MSLSISLYHYLSLPWPSLPFYFYYPSPFHSHVPSRSRNKYPATDRVSWLPSAETHSHCWMAAPGRSCWDLSNSTHNTFVTSRKERRERENHSITNLPKSPNSGHPKLRSSTVKAQITTKPVLQDTAKDNVSYCKIGAKVLNKTAGWKKGLKCLSLPQSSSPSHPHSLSLLSHYAKSWRRYNSIGLLGEERRKMA